MASTNNRSMTGDLEELITCVICMEVLSNPHTLPCLHSFCYTCILKISNQHPNPKIVCPNCRAEADVAAIKHDFKMSQFIELYKHGNSQRKKKKYSDNANSSDDVCQLCEVNPITDACKCNGLFCVTCLKGHRKYTKCVERDVQSLDVLSNDCLEKLQELQKSVLEDIAELHKQLEEKSVQCRDEQNRAKSCLLEKVDNIANEHRKKVEVELTQQLKKLADLKELLWKTINQSKAGVVKAFEGIRNQVQSERKEGCHLVCPPLKISVHDACINDQALVSVAVPEHSSLTDLVDKTLSIKHTIHLDKDVRRVKMIHGNIWCLLSDRIIIMNILSEPIQTITFPNVRNVFSTDSGDIIFLSYSRGVYKIDRSQEDESTTCLLTTRRYHDICVADGLRYAVHVTSGKFCLDELNEDYQLVQHRISSVSANESHFIHLVIANAAVFVSSAQFDFIYYSFARSNDSTQFRLGPLEPIQHPIYTDGQQLLLSNSTGLHMCKLDSPNFPVIKLPPGIPLSCYCTFVDGKKLYVAYYDGNFKCWSISVLSF